MTFLIAFVLVVAFGSSAIVIPWAVEKANHCDSFIAVVLLLLAFYGIIAMVLIHATGLGLRSLV